MPPGNLPFSNYESRAARGSGIVSDEEDITYLSRERRVLPRGNIGEPSRDPVGQEVESSALKRGLMSGIFIGEGREIREISDDEFMKAIKHLPEEMAKRLQFMSADHHAIRDFVVREMPRQSRAISPRQIAAATAIDSHRVRTILSELEAHLFFLARNSAGDVCWAFPVTTERTAHRLSFSTGENIFGA